MIGSAHKLLALTTCAARPTYPREMVYAPDKASAAFWSLQRRLSFHQRHQGQRIDAYKNHRMRDKAAHDLVIRAVDVGACTNRMIPAVVKEWRDHRQL